SDLFFRAYDGTEYYFEVKAPQPNKDKCLRIIRRLLTIYLIRNQTPPRVNALFAMAYNPYGASRSSYNWSVARAHLPFDEALVIGHEFWDLVGNYNTYVELLEIYREIG